MNRKKQIITLFLVLPLGWLLLQPRLWKSFFPPPKTEFFSTLKFSDALAEAGRQNRVVFVDFYTTWCPPCKEMDRSTWQDPAVIRLLTGRTIPLKIDAEKETQLAQKYNVDAYPTLLLIKPDGSVLDRVVGYKNGENLVAIVEQSLAGFRFDAVESAVRSPQPLVTPSKQFNRSY